MHNAVSVSVRSKNLIVIKTKIYKGDIDMRDNNRKLTTTDAGIPILTQDNRFMGSSAPLVQGEVSAARVC
jgi:hypothetical protein